MLPLVVLLGWFVTEQSPRWLSNVPGWLRPTATDAAVGACEALASVNAYRGQYINFVQPTTVLPDEAQRLARGYTEATYSVTLADASSLSAPTLVRATFPGVGERVAWMVIATLPRAADARFDRVGIVFVDAERGELLALDSAVSVVDAASACGGGPIGRRALVRQYLPVLLAVGYAGLVAFGWVVQWAWRRRGGKTASA